jgi:hypothetical protein
MQMMPTKMPTTATPPVKPISVNRMWSDGTAPPLFETNTANARA